jgi:hypothetical protein
MFKALICSRLKCEKNSIQWIALSFGESDDGKSSSENIISIFCGLPQQSWNSALWMRSCVQRKEKNKPEGFNIFIKTKN